MSNKVNKQVKITALFGKLPKRKLEENYLEKENQVKVNGSCSSDFDDHGSKKENIHPNKKLKSENILNGKKSKLAPSKCRECRQHIADVVLFPGDPPNAEEEFVALTNECLSEFIGNEDTGRPQHKITEFCIYDKHTHLCSFDAGLIEKNVELYFSGVIKPVFDENPSPDNGVPAKRLGPINEWYTAGFDGGEKALVGFSTAFADYFLMEPLQLYQDFWSSVQEKIYMSKNVIEFLSLNPNAGYEDLVNRIQTTVPPTSLGVAKFTEDSLLRHAQFVVEQVESYDSARDEFDDALLGTPCMRDLIHLAGATLGKRRAARNLLVKEKKHVKASSSKATTTRLVAEIMEQFFQGTVDSSTGKKIRRRRCGVCEVCARPECGKCSACRDMVKFGGSGRAKQTCVERKCPNLGIELDDGNETEEDADPRSEPILEKPSKLTRAKHSGLSKVDWIEEPMFDVTDEDGRAFYSSIRVNQEEYHIGDCVCVQADDPGKPPYIGKLMSMWEQTSKFCKKDKMVHVDWFVRASETLLQEAGDARELFLVDECEDLKANCIESKVLVHHLPPHKEWFFMGGVQEDRQLPKCDGLSTFFYQKWYDPELARFEDPPEVAVSDEPDFCPSCERLSAAKRRETPTATRQVSVEDDVTYYEIASLNGVDYKVGDSIYLPTTCFGFSTKAAASKKKTSVRSVHGVDENEYPEYYRKGGHIKGSNEEVAEPFRIARILTIFVRRLGKRNDIKLKVNKFFRPENTHKTLKSTYYSDLNLLFWSDEEVVVDLAQVQGKCRVECECDLQVTPAEYSRQDVDNFYFSEAYNSKAREFYEPPLSSRRAGVRELVKKYTRTPKKLTKLTKITNAELKKEAECKDEVCRSAPRLRSLDVFSGCGGLSEGLHQAGIAESKYAIELWEPAAQAYRLNNPGATVFTEDCNILLEMVMSGKEKSNCGQKLPQKGDIELLCGGPPCQGFSGMNRFNSREYSRFKNSLVVSYLSYCDYYRPRFFLLENVRNFVSFKNCMVLKLSLAALVKMGYQCTFGVLQAGHYGVAQTRRRAIILAAAPGEKLPLYPEPLHTFSARSGSLSALVGDRKYMTNISRMFSAPFRTITVRDTMSDLPAIKNGHSKVEMAYRGEAESHFQRLIRSGNCSAILHDHVCKDMSPLVEARMSRIPLAPGSDWRDLPNVVVKLSDGTSTKLLRYEHHDRKQGKNPTGALRGVCSCATGKACDPIDRQFNTLIPWCLPHTGNRHNHWAGLYGRLDWDGFFSTTVTNPEPMGKQGRVLHPEQDRVVSVRECARSQGFPDSYRFFGSILDKHREVGNAVPPPMAKAIGLEVKKCLGWKLEQIDRVKPTGGTVTIADAMVEMT